MEKWRDTFANQIPKDVYTVDLSFGEDSGLRITLNGEKNENVVLIEFGAISSYSLLDEGILLSGDHFNSAEIEKNKATDFKSTIYEIESGKYSKFVNNISNGLFSIYDMKHYIIITLNYVIEVASSFEPIIKVLK